MVTKAIFSMIAVVLLAAWMFTSVGCDDTGILNPDCFADGAITADEYDGLNALEQLTYVENSCGLYVPRNAKNMFDDVDEWF